MDTPKILITGGLGFIFSHVTEYFVAKGWNVVVIDNESAGSHPEIIDGSFTYYKLNVADPAILDIFKRESPDYVIHAAAISDVDFSITSPHQTLLENMVGNLNVFEACRILPNLKKFVYVSTDEIYGECDHKKIEGAPIAPKNPYSASKAIGSLMRVAYDNTYTELRDKITETRFCNVFGPRQDKRKIFALIRYALETGQSIPLHNDGLGYREYIYVKNIPHVVDLILEKGTRAYNVTANEGCTVSELLSHVERVTGRKVPRHEAVRPGMDMRYQSDASRLFADLGWKPQYTFTDGIREYFGDLLKE